MSNGARDDLSCFQDLDVFQDDVHGPIRLSALERDVVDTPEFQRLFRISQLGFVDLVKQTANHTRGSHSIGTCEMASRLMDRLERNRQSSRNEDFQRAPRISPSERVLIRLGALLHDVPHGPLSHDIEKKSHMPYPEPGSGKGRKFKSYYGLYDKHDDCEANPTLYLLLMDDHSILARVLRSYSKQFVELMRKDWRAIDPGDPKHKKPAFPHIVDFGEHLHGLTDWAELHLLPSLLFHLLIYETIEQASQCQRCIATSWKAPGENGDESGAPVTQTLWGLGPERERSWLHKAWYRAYRHDIIGNTLSADLLDYLTRDTRHLGLNRGIELDLLNYYVLARPPGAPTGNAIESDALYRCAIDVYDHKRGTLRTELLNDIFRLLDLRHEIHEKAVTHRVVQSASAMLARSALLLGPRCPRAPELVGVGESDCSTRGDDWFLHAMIARCHTAESQPGPGAEQQAHRLLLKLAERRVYRPLMIIPGDRVTVLFENIQAAKEHAESHLRTLATILDTAYFAPFFLFISARVEEFLRDGTCSEESLLGCINRVAHLSCADDRLRRIMDEVPAGVIISTAPYKQLYKDPALVVAARNVVAPLDRIGAAGSPAGAEKDSPLDVCTKAAREDVEEKYRGLWKVYVFLSDGLFYRGVVRKHHALPNGSRPVERGSPHLERLRKAQILIYAAIRVAIEHWPKASGGGQPYSGDAATWTWSTRIDPAQFLEMLQNFVKRYRQWSQTPPPGLKEASAVDVQQYYHGDHREHAFHRNNCRDIRNKTAAPVSNHRWNLETQHNAVLQELITRSGLRQEDVTDVEFDDIVERCARIDVVESLRRLHGAVANRLKSLTEADELAFLARLYRNPAVWEIDEPKA